MDVGELIGEIAMGAGWKCPFAHSPTKPPDKPNTMPPVDGKDTNDADELGKKLRENSWGMLTHKDVPVTVGSKTTKHDVQYTPHHLVPGNESWPETKLLRWVDKDKGHVKADIGYNVNAAENGVDLPGIHGIGNTAWSGKSTNFQKEYAFAAMGVSTPRRQFHDRHPKYSSFVVNVLDAIAEKLDKTNQGKTPGCGKKYCGGEVTKPFDPPVGMIERLNGVAERLEGYLTGSAINWKAPIFTSRFAYMYHRHMRSGSNLTQDAARKAISAMDAG